MNDLEEHQKNITAGARLVGAVIGCVFAGIGICVIGFLWFPSFNSFHSPPLFFRVFGSFIAIPFVVIGSFTAYCSIKAKGIVPKPDLPRQARQQKKSVSYVCPQCNAPLSENIDVSPHGDVKCGYCNSWFNIHDD